MNTKQKFGGPCTVEKLNILSDYLNFYATALKKQPFKLIYIDAFAGTGHINIGDNVDEIIDGSAKLALQSNGNFTEYIFIEKNEKFATELSSMVKHDFPHKAHKVCILNEDCNQALLKICKKVDWDHVRAVLFLDPYAASVEWSTLKTISETHAIDVWYLFPFNATTRMLKKTGEINPAWENKLNAIFGTESWKTDLYQEDPQTNLFGETNQIRIADTIALQRYIETRLKTIFPSVSKHSRILHNSRSSPLFLFCFAVSNQSEKAQKLALSVADYILRDKTSKNFLRS